MVKEKMQTTQAVAIFMDCTRQLKARKQFWL